MSRKLRILLVFISLSLTLSLMSNTYSRYVADTTSNVEMQFASWQILVNENDITSSTTSSSSSNCRSLCPTRAQISAKSTET